MKRCLVALLPFVEVLLALLCFALDNLVLLSVVLHSMCFHHVAIARFPVTPLSLAIGICLFHGRQVLVLLVLLLLKSLGDAWQRVRWSWGSLESMCSRFG